MLQWLSFTIACNIGGEKEKEAETAVIRSGLFNALLERFIVGRDIVCCMEMQHTG
jgi:hypothetical protein